MKKIYFLVLMLVSSIVVFSNSIVVIDAQESGLQVTFSTNPTIVAPGTKGIIELNLKSIGIASNIEITAISQSWVIVQKGDWDLSVGYLEGGTSYSVLFEFSVSSTASSGLYLVNFEVFYSEGNTIFQNAVVKVEDSNVLDLISVTPSSIVVGESTTLVFNISNNRGSDIYNVLFNWEDPNDLILPIGSDNRITISSIAAENYTEVPIVVMASSGISPGVYPITVTMEFYDQTGTKQIVSSTVGLQISGATTFDVILQTSSSTSTTFAIVNTGANTASSVVVSIPQQQGYSTTGTSSSSLGNLDAGDYTLTSFQLSSTISNITNQFPTFNRTGMGNPPQNTNFSIDRNMFMNQSSGAPTGNQLILQISYTDLFGVRQTIQKQVDLNSGSVSGFTSRNINQGNNGIFPNGFSDQSQSSDSNNSLMYISIGIVGIIIIVTVIQLGRKKKLGRLSKFFKGRKE